jgi:hypothetical protein
MQSSSIQRAKERLLKILARGVAVASIVLGLYLVTRSYRLETDYAARMPHVRDLQMGRGVEVVIGRDTTVFVSDPEAKALDAARTSMTFGWPFIILGGLLIAASRERRPPVDVAPESENPWAARR